MFLRLPMPRPSRNIDQLLISAGLELLPAVGTRALSIRQVCEHAGVNLGMFHYHFKTRDAFLRAVLQQMYDGMFMSLEFEAGRDEDPLARLRVAVMTLARFARDQRLLLARLIGDALAGETVAVAFLQNNLPRHISLVGKLITAAQRRGALRRIPVMQALAFLIGGTGAPILLGTAASGSGLLPESVTTQFEATLLADDAIAVRVDMALAGLAAPAERAIAQAATQAKRKAKTGARI
jgi:AcrR family transcriptional regulator